MSHYLSAARTSTPLSNRDLLQTAGRFGSNKLEIPLPLFMDLYIESLLAPFFIFQVFCIFLWLLDEYWKYSLLTLVMMLIFEATVVYGRLRSLKELHGMRNPSHTIYTYRNKKWAPISSLDLLPGDIVSIGRGSDESHVVPCDLLILSGNAVVNESMLTGESVPLMKEEVSSLDGSMEEILSIKDKHKSNMLFGGTRILTHTPAVVSNCTPSARPPDNGCVSYVLRTGFGSSQGKLMRTILYSTESVSANSAEAAIFILFLLTFAIMASGYVLYHRYSTDAGARYKLLLRCVLIVTSVVPPELPMQLALAVNTSLVALVKNLIFCTEPFRIPFAGKIDICCLDKTGTITTDSINAAGVALPVSPAGDNDGGGEYTMVPVLEGSIDSSLVLAVCHSLVYVDNELIGDPLERAALDSVEWTYGRSGTCVPSRGGAASAFGKILRRYRFTSDLQRMSVIAEVGGNVIRNGPRVLVKGSPEAVGNLLEGGTVPDMYHETARKLARGGMRVLALAQKDLSPGMTASELTKIVRDDAESDLSFVGFVCFECPVRPDSRKVIRMLKKSNHIVTMITGDSTLTAVHVAAQVEMCTKSVLILDKSELNPGSLEWFSANSGKRKKRFAAESIPELAEEFDLCVSGPALQLALEVSGAMRNMLKHIKVFARMSPDQKENVLTALKEAGLFTMMCGDGTNDVGALRQAHVGVALLSTTATPNGSKERMNSLNVQAEVSSDTQGKIASKGRKKSDIRQRKKSKTGNGGDATLNAEDSTRTAKKPKTAREKQQRAYEKKMKALTKSFEETDDQPPLVKLGDASIASAFTSRRMTIESCASIIRQGRCTLATTMQMYQILALNCLISAYSLSVLYLRGVVLGDKQMTITGMVLAVASFMVARAKPLKKLSPRKPASTIFAPELFLSLLGQFAVHVVALIAGMKYADPYMPNDEIVDIDADFEPSLLNSVVFLLAIAQQISVYVLNYKGRPHMQGLFDNKALMNSLIIAAGILTLCTLEVSREFNDMLELVPWPDGDLQMKIGGVILFDLVGSFVVDKIVKFIFEPKTRI